MNDTTTTIKAVSGPRTAFWRTRLGVMLAIIAASITVLLGAPVANAYVAPNGATYYRTVSYCDALNHTVLREFDVYPQRGRSRQWVAARTYFVDEVSGARGWSAWTAPTLIYAQRRTDVVSIGGELRYPSGRLLRFYTQYVWWNGTRWSAPAGAWDTYYGMHGTRPTPTRVCVT